MEIMLRLQCPVCLKSFIVDDDDVDDGGELGCPHCSAGVEVPEDED